MENIWSMRESGTQKLKIILRKNACDLKSPSNFQIAHMKLIFSIADYKLFCSVSSTVFPIAKSKLSTCTSRPAITMCNMILAQPRQPIIKVLGTVNYGASGYASGHASAVASAKWSLGEVASTLTVPLHFMRYIYNMITNSDLIWYSKWRKKWSRFTLSKRLQRRFDASGALRFFGASAVQIREVKRHLKRHLKHTLKRHSWPSLLRAMSGFSV